MKRNAFSQINLMIIFIISVVSVFCFTYFQQFIPVIFKSDSKGLQEGLMFTLNNKSYEDTSLFYKMIGFRYSTPLIFIQLFSWVIFLLILVTILRINRNIDFSLYEFFSLIFFLIMYTFFFAQYSKDLIVILFMLIALNVYITNKRFFFFIIFIFIYATFFRSYWFILLFMCIFIDIQYKPSIKKNLLYIFCFIVILIIFYNFVKGSQITNVRAPASVFVSGQRAHSVIINIIPNSSFITDILNYLYVLVNLVLPIHGFYSSNMVFYYIWIWSIIVAVCIHKKVNNNKLLLLFLCYLNIQALFEPDFGSVFRHQIVFFPMIYYYIFSNYKIHCIKN